jgi:hypothetical protein
MKKKVDTWDIYAFNLILNSRNDKKITTYNNLS